jgi:hypothetical protein
MGIDYRNLSLGDALRRDPRILDSIERLTGRPPQVIDLLGGLERVPNNPPVFHPPNSPELRPAPNGGQNGGIHINARFDTVGSVWELRLTHAEVMELRRRPREFLRAIGFPEELAILIEGITYLIVIVDAIGLNNGVNITGILQTTIVTVTPRIVSAMGILKRIVDALREIGLPSEVAGAGVGVGIGVLAIGPAGAVIGGFAGWLGDALFGGGPRPGDVHCDRQVVGPWEKFLPIAVDKDASAVLSWRGYFCAENGGGNAVHANRLVVGPWEKVKIIPNANGTVSLRSENDHYLCAENGGGDGSFCMWNRAAVGEWEQFIMEWQSDGSFALKTLSKGTYVSVQ